MEFITRKIIIWTPIALLVLVALHLLVWMGAALAIAFPNAFRVFQDYGEPQDVGLKATSLELEGGEHAWWFPHAESKRVVVVCHGRSRGKAYMMPLVAPLAEHYNVLTFDFPGHGENPFGTTSLGAREAASVGHAVRHLEQAGYTDVVLFGTSMGGASALRWLGENPSPVVKGIITDGVFARLRPYLMSKGADYLVPTYLRTAAIDLAGSIAEYDPGAVNPVDAIGKITVPGLLLHGDRDPLVPVENHGTLLAAAGPRFHHTIYPGVHDEPHNPDLARLVLEFLGELEHQ